MFVLLVEDFFHINVAKSKVTENVRIIRFCLGIKLYSLLEISDRKHSTWVWYLDTIFGSTFAAQESSEFEENVEA